MHYLVNYRRLRAISLLAMARIARSLARLVRPCGNLRPFPSGGGGRPLITPTIGCIDRIISLSRSFCLSHTRPVPATWASFPTR